jgi:hypothetical protein
MKLKFIGVVIIVVSMNLVWNKINYSHHKPHDGNVGLEQSQIDPQIIIQNKNRPSMSSTDPIGFHHAQKTTTHHFSVNRDTSAQIISSTNRGSRNTELLNNAINAEESIDSVYDYQFDDMTQSPQIPETHQEAAIWVELGDPNMFTQEQKEDLDRMAMNLKETLEQSGLDPCSPEYLKLWNDEANKSDELFSIRYGDGIWMQHHIEAHQLALQRDEENISDEAEK